MFCKNCGAAINDNAANFCMLCGISMQNESGTINNTETSLIGSPDEDLKLFIGAKADYYLGKRKPADKFISKYSWNWAAFWLNSFWLGYRKLYIPVTAVLGFMILLAVLKVNPAVQATLYLLFLIFLGLYGNALYLQLADHKISLTKTKYQEKAVQNSELAKAGGPSFVGVILVIFLCLIYAGINLFNSPWLNDGSINKGKQNAIAVHKTQSDKPENAQELKSTVNKKFTDSDFERLYKGYSFLGKQEYKLNGHYFAVIAMAKAGTSEMMVRLAVCRLTDKWTETWHAPNDLETTPAFKDSLKDDPQIYLPNLELITDDTSALAAANVLVGGAHGTTQVLAFTIDKMGRGSVKLFDSAGIMTVEKQDRYITVKGEGAFSIHKLSLDNGIFREQITPLSDASAADAVKAVFVLDEYDNVTGVDTPDLRAKVGETIAFIPGDAKAKQVFDEGGIEIFCDASNGPPLTLCEANRIKSGNSYTFEQPGTVHFLLTPAADEQAATFTITVVE